MATKLYRLGHWCIDHRDRVSAGSRLVPRLPRPRRSAARPTQSSRSPGRSPSAAQDLLEEKYPGASGASARVVFAAPEGQAHRRGYRDGVDGLGARARRRPTTSRGSIDPYRLGRSAQGRPHRLRRRHLPGPRGRGRRQGPRRARGAARPAKDAGPGVEFSGGLVTDESQQQRRGHRASMIGFVVLAITLGSLLAAGLPLLTALIGVAIPSADRRALSGVVDLTETAPDAGHDARPRRRHRLRAVHPLAPPADLDDGHGAARGGRAGDGDGGQRRRVRRHDRRHRPCRPDRRGIPFLTVMGLAAAGTVGSPC